MPLNMITMKKLWHVILAKLFAMLVFRDQIYLIYQFEILSGE